MNQKVEVCLIDTLGERIRTLRKQRKMTLEALAGDQLTKGMLSLIENNKANPSMESLTYIARRLEIDPSELLEDNNRDELKSILDKVDPLYHVPFDEVTDENEQIIQLIEPILPKLGRNYESARLLEMYGRTLHFLKFDSWVTYVDRAADIYDELNIMYRRARIGIFRALAKFVIPDYPAALATMLEERQYIESTHAYIEPMTRIDLDYHEAILQFAVGDSKAATEVVERAIGYSKEQRVFYNVDYLYRLAAVQALMMYDEERVDFYCKKLIHYAEFTDEKEPLIFTKFLEFHQLTSYRHDYAKALSLIKTYEKDFKDQLQYNPHLYLETGKALYGVGRIEEAIQSLLKVEIPEFTKHPVDLSIFYEGEAYLAKCYAAMGENEEARKWALLAKDHISLFPDSPYKTFIQQTYEELT
ncbi:helix-turn-helix domain-containing protein [Sporosarcina sp. Te-1]|uniref:helix-turn-helix domain-containing protein n=1 Tax=Sporosarcina sp. Te-1 TaxID=2818390 RepID=UPI001A9DD23A|nr:helix-turn-helix domain-containing protein [Sporosarcina sp. Te-1]QTD39594.1 helix-turn-helix domain-containing protein [Sporosarcina sp. Te-1]